MPSVNPARRPRPLRFACPALLASSLACSPGESPIIAPTTLYFAPHQTTRSLSIHNPGAEAIPLRKIRLDTATPDWGSFLLTDETLPREIPAGAGVELQISADSQHFVDERPHGAAPRYRRGQARLLFAANGARSVDLRFEPAAGDAPWVLLTKLGLFATLVAGLGLVGRRRGLLGTIPWLFLLVVATLPWGPALCFGGLGEPLSASALGQCAEGYGGTPLSLSTPTGGLLLCFALLLLGDLTRCGATLRGAAPATELRLGLRRLLCDLAAILAIAPALIASASLDPAAQIEHQLASGWGLLSHPVAALLAAGALLQRPTSARRVDLEEFALASLYSLVFLGGWALPGPGAAIHALPHGLFIVLALFCGLAKIAGTIALLRRLRRRTAERRQGADSLHLWLLGLAAAALLIRASVATLSAVV